MDKPHFGDKVNVKFFIVVTSHGLCVRRSCANFDVQFDQNSRFAPFSYPMLLNCIILYHFNHSWNFLDKIGNFLGQGVYIRANLFCHSAKPKMYLVTSCSKGLIKIDKFALFFQTMGFFSQSFFQNSLYNEVSLHILPKCVSSTTDT